MRLKVQEAKKSFVEIFHEEDGQATRASQRFAEFFLHRRLFYLGKRQWQIFSQKNFHKQQKKLGRHALTACVGRLKSEKSESCFGLSEKKQLKKIFGMLKIQNGGLTLQ